MNFNKRTLVTVTAPTCAGKNFLLEELISNHGFCKIVSTTTRPKRHGEVEGVDYFFIPLEQSTKMAEDNKFIERVEYNGVYYGVTFNEITQKLNSGKAPIVILTPHGLKNYEKYCVENEIDIFKTFILTPENIRLDRLAERTTKDILNSLESSTLKTYSSQIKKLIKANNARMIDIIVQERNWETCDDFVYIDGTDRHRAIQELEHAISETA